MADLGEIIEMARQAQVEHEQRHDTQLELPTKAQERIYTHCSNGCGELDSEGWCPNYCTVED